MTTHTNDTQANIDLIRDAFAAFNRADLDATEDFLTEDFLINLAGMPYQQRGKQAWRKNIEMIHRAFPGVQARIEDIFAADDRVAVRLTFTGTHGDEFLDIPATGREVEYTSFEHYRVADGKLAEEWICSDIATLMRQLTGTAAQ